MKLRTVVLVGLVLAHVSASALPDACLINYRKSSENLTKEINRIANETMAVASIGYGLGGAGVGSCIWQGKTLVGKAICSALFLALGYVAYEYSGDLERQRQRMVESATIYEIYQDFKSGESSELANTALVQVGMTSTKDAQVKSAWIQMMESREFCDTRGRPNRHLAEVIRAVQFKVVD